MELGNCIKSELPNPKVSQSYRQFVAKHPGRAPGTCITEEIKDDRKRKSVSTIRNGVLTTIGTKRFACAEPSD